MSTFETAPILEAPSRDEQVVEAVINLIIESPKYQRRLSLEDSDSAHAISLNDIGLTPTQQALLVGEKYLAARPAVGTTFSATCLPHLMIADQINDKVIRIVDPQTPQSPKTPYSPTDISPFMQQLVSRIDARIALRQRNIDNDEKLYQQIEVVKNQHFSDLEPHLHPAINSWLLLEILYSIQTHAPQTKKWQQSIRTRALALQAQEQQAAALPPIGLEIEVPWTGAVEIDPKNPLPMTYSAFTEHFLLLEHLGIPISGDKQGEVSLRHSPIALPLNLPY